MYKLDKYRVKIEANLNPGFYLLRAESATGKTYLASLLDNYKNYGEPVGKYSYSEFTEGTKIRNSLRVDTKLFMLDRLDMYYSMLPLEEIDTLVDASKRTIILADLKHAFRLKGVVPYSAVIEYLNPGYILIEE